MMIEKKTVEKKFQPVAVLTISFAHMVHDTYSAFLAPILPLLIAKFGLSLTMAGLLTVVGRLPSLLNPLFGILADKIGGRYFVIATPSVTAVSMSLLGVAPGYPVLVLLCFIMGTSAALFHVPTPVMVKQVSGDRVGMGMSFYMVGGELARSIGPMVILAAVSWWTLEGTYRLIPFGILASLVLYTRLRKIEMAGRSQQKPAMTGVKETMKRYLPFFMVLGGILLTRAFMRAALTAFLPTYLNIEKGESLWISGISLSIVQLAGAAGTFFSGFVSDKIGRKTTLLIVAVGSPVLMVFFLVVDGVLVIPFLVLLGFTLTSATPVMLALVQDLESDRPAFLNSIFMSINFVFGALGVLAVGIMGDIMALETTYWICLGMSAMAVPFILKIKKG